MDNRERNTKDCSHTHTGIPNLDPNTATQIQNPIPNPIRSVDSVVHAATGCSDLLPASLFSKRDFRKEMKSYVRLTHSHKYGNMGS